MALKEFKLPDIGEGIAEGEIVSWKVKAGQAVKEEDEFVEVMTDKATVTITVPFTGTIAELRCKEGEVVPVGSVIAVIDAGAVGGAAPAAAAPAKPATPPPAPAAAPKAAAPAPTVAPAPKPVVVPAVAPVAAPAAAAFVQASPGKVLAAPATRRHMQDFLAAREEKRLPVSNIEQGHISSACCILANLSMDLGRNLKWDAAAGKVAGDDEANGRLARPYRAPWTHPLSS